MKGNIIIEKEKEVNIRTKEIEQLISEGEALKENKENMQYQYVISPIIKVKKEALNLLIDELISLIEESPIKVVNEYWKWALKNN